MKYVGFLAIFFSILFFTLGYAGDDVVGQTTNKLTKEGTDGIIYVLVSIIVLFFGIITTVSIMYVKSLKARIADSDILKEVVDNMKDMTDKNDKLRSAIYKAIHEMKIQAEVCSVKNNK